MARSALDQKKKIYTYAACVKPTSTPHERRSSTCFRFQTSPLLGFLFLRGAAHPQFLIDGASSGDRAAKITAGLLVPVTGDRPVQQAEATKR
jgi:hypothetical protein